VEEEVGACEEDASGGAISIVEPIPELNMVVNPLPSHACTEERSLKENPVSELPPLPLTLNPMVQKGKVTLKKQVFVIEYRQRNPRYIALQNSV
jgi:hypothetical protein